MHKVVLIGAGRIGQIHAGNAARHPRIELAGIVDAVAASAETLAQKHHTIVTQLDTALEDDSVSGVIIACPTDLHLEYCTRAAATGKTIFCEKPLDQSAERAREAAGALSGARLLMAFNRRFDPNFQSLKKRLDDSAIGRLESLQITSNDPAPPPAAYIAVSGGLFKDMAIHDFDMARWLLGEEPVQVYAAGSCLVDPAIGELGDIDTARCILTTASGKLCVISNSRRSGYGYDQRIEAFASGGMVCADNIRETTVQIWNESGTTSAPLENFFLDRYAAAYRREMDHFADMLDGAPASVGYRDGLAALMLAEAATESMRSGRPVRL